MRTVLERSFSFSQELPARDSGSWLGALWPSFYLEALLPPPSTPPPPGRKGWLGIQLPLLSLRHLG